MRKMGWVLAAMGAVAVAGCQSHKSSRPFADVTDRQKAVASDAGAPIPTSTPVAGAPQAAPAAASAGQPQIVQGVVPVVVMPDSNILPAADEPQSQVVVNVRQGGFLRRAWPVSVAWRPSGDALAWPTYYHQVGELPRRPEWRQSVYEIGYFWWDTLLLPINMVRTYPDTPVIYSAAGNKGKWREVEQAGYLHSEEVK